ncbi:NAD(P)-dependent oxidoreductase [Streptomyces sp. NBC_00009]|uniref:NAD(P)-dependent oxidoreductase n=1 Tax=Streptomyces sp. NBC_00009 TaxID=2975620 RepID=UPI00324C852C
MSRIVIFGAAGRLGSRIVAEAAFRGHHVTAVARTTDHLTTLHDGATAQVGDPTDPDSVRTLATGTDVLVSAVGGPDKAVYLTTARTLVTTLKRIGDTAPRIIHCGGGGSLLNDEGVRMVDVPGFPAELRDEVLGQAAALDYYRASTGVTWTYVSPPPGNFAPGRRTGQYRTGTDHPVTRPDGTFGISYEDYALALVDEIETASHLDTRFTVGY